MGHYCVNVFVVVRVLVVGFGFGGWASMINFIRQVDTFWTLHQVLPVPSQALMQINGFDTPLDLYVKFEIVPERVEVPF